jgi:membrane protease YdiL (CAAX protease family)
LEKVLEKVAPLTLPRASKGVLRIVVGTLAIFGALFVYRRLLWPPIESVLQLPEPWQLVVGRSGSLLASIGAYFLFVRWYEKRQPIELALRPVPTVLAAVIGAALISITIGVLYLTGHYVIESTRPLALAVPVICTIIVAAVVEELTFRALAFRILEEHVGTLPALAVVSVAFGALHLFNTGTTNSTFVSVTLCGALWCCVFIITRNVWATGLNHAAWNLAIFFSGVPLSGQEEWRQYAPVVSHAQGPTWLTGGSFGPEDSIVTIGILAVVVLVLLHGQRQRSRNSDSRGT